MTKCLLYTKVHWVRIRSNPEEFCLLQQLHLEAVVPRPQALNLSPITAAISLLGRSLHALCFLLQAMAAGLTCSGAMMANAYSQSSCATIVAIATTTAMKCNRVVSVSIFFFFLVIILEILL